MREKAGRRLELAANVATIALALVAGGVLLERSLGRRGSSGPVPAVGSKIALPAADLEGADRVVVLALSTTCRYCTDSAPFYRRLAAAASGKNVRVIAVMPQPAAEGRQYLAGLGLQGVPVSAPLPSFRVAGTPTIIVVRGDGTVQQSWTGQLPTAQEREVLASISSINQRRNES